MTCNALNGRSLGLAGIGSVVVAPPGDAAHYSRHTKGAVPWSDAWDQPDRLVDALIAHGEAQGEPPVLIHGRLTTIGEIEGWVQPLATTRQVIAVEMQGHGRMADTDGPRRLPR